MRGGAPRDGAEVRFGVELRDDQLHGDLTGLILEGTEGHRELHLPVGRNHTCDMEQETQLKWLAGRN